MFGLCPLARHGISDSFLFERRTSAVVVMGKLSRVMLVGIKIICAVAIIWIVGARLRQSRARAERAGVPRPVGGPRARDAERHALCRRLAGRHVALRAREIAATGLPHRLLLSTLYQRWVLATEKNVVERGLAGADELEAGHALRAGKPLKRKLTADVVEQGMTRGSFFRQPQAPARFKRGDRVRTKNIHPPTHTRLPRYACGRFGVVELVHDCHAFPDAVAIDKGDDPQWPYTVVFDGHELWGADADPTVKVAIDAFEPYLDPA